jgi:hypothetical protein
MKAMASVGAAGASCGLHFAYCCGNRSRWTAEDTDGYLRTDTDAAYVPVGSAKSFIHS